MILAPLGVGGLRCLADALVGVGEDEANVQHGVFSHDALVLLSISSDEPSLGFYDDTVGEDEVSTVASRLQWWCVLDLRCFVADRDGQAAELIRNLILKSTTVTFDQPALIRSLLRRHLLLRRSLPSVPGSKLLRKRSPLPHRSRDLQRHHHHQNEAR